MAFLVSSETESDGSGEASILSSAADALSLVECGEGASLAASLFVKISLSRSSAAASSTFDLLEVRGSATGLSLVEAVAHALSNTARTLKSDKRSGEGKVFWQDAAHDCAALLSNLSRTPRGRSSVQFVMICQERDRAVAAGGEQGTGLASSLLKIAAGAFPSETRAACLACLSNASFAPPGSLDKKTRLVRELIATMGACRIALSLLKVSTGDADADAGSNELEQWDLRQRAAGVLARFAREVDSHKSLRNTETISKLCKVLGMGVSSMERSPKNGKVRNTVANLIRALAILLSFPNEGGGGDGGQAAAQYMLSSIKAVVRGGAIESMLKLFAMSVSEGLKVGRVVYVSVSTLSEADCPSLSPFLSFSLLFFLFFSLSPFLALFLPPQVRMDPDRKAINANGCKCLIWCCPLDPERLSEAAREAKGDADFDFTSEHDASQLVIRKGAVPMLVKLLSIDDNETVRKNLAVLLARLARKPEGMKELKACGGLRILMEIGAKSK